MRWVISAAAFLVPMLLVVAIGSCVASPGASATSEARPNLPPRRMDELTRFVQGNEAILDQYAAKTGTGGRAMPHLALEIFARRGCDEDGHPWYLLAMPPSPGVDGGVLRRATGDRRPVTTVAGARPHVLMPLAGQWWYWEGAARPAGGAKSP